MLVPLGSLDTKIGIVNGSCSGGTSHHLCVNLDLFVFVYVNMSFPTPMQKGVFVEYGLNLCLNDVPWPVL